MKYFFFFLFIVLFSCSEKKKTENSTADSKKTLLPAPLFSQDSAYYFIEKQLSFGYRIPNSKAHEACGNFLIEKLMDYCDTVIVQPFETLTFDEKKINCRNIIGSFFPDRKKRVLLAAHWDSRPFADQDEENKLEPIKGANDGASGVAVLLEIANKIKQNRKNINIGIDIIFFDAEDYGTPHFLEQNSMIAEDSSTFCLGSQYWVKKKHKKKYSAYFGILLDMVASKDGVFRLEGYSQNFAPKVLKKVWGIAKEMGYENYFYNEPSFHVLDDHYFITKYADIPTIDIIQTSKKNKNIFFEAWHTHKDDMSGIDKNTLKAVGQIILTLLYNE